MKNDILLFPTPEEERGKGAGFMFYNLFYLTLSKIRKREENNPARPHSRKKAAIPSPLFGVGSMKNN